MWKNSVFWYVFTFLFFVSLVVWQCFCKVQYETRRKAYEYEIIIIFIVKRSIIIFWTHYDKSGKIMKIIKNRHSSNGELGSRQKKEKIKKLKIIILRHIWVLKSFYIDSWVIWLYWLKKVLNSIKYLLSNRN